MPELNEDRDRNVVPRWRSFHSKISLFEAKPLLQSKTLLHVPSDSFDSLVADWKQYGTFSYAADLLGCAVAIHRENEVRDVAQYILDDPRPGFKALRSIASRIVGIVAPTPSKLDIVDQESLIQYESNNIQELRLKAKRYPQNALLWLDIALAYEILGIPNKADKAIRIALVLAPENRFVLRSSCRFLIHQNRYRDAYELLLRSPGLKSDPWLLAAFLVTAQPAQRPHRFVKVARRMLNASRFGPFHISELASAVGMLEFSSGRTKAAQKLFKLSLVQPTENAIAQAFWIKDKLSRATFIENNVNGLPLSHEACAWHYRSNLQWEQSLSATWRWLSDQPFSVRPAIHGSYIASRELGRLEESAQIAHIGLLANPHESTLINNYAFAAAQTKNLDSAKKVFAGIKLSSIAGSIKTACTATKGLLCFRDGQAGKGRRYYREAINLAKQSGETEQQAAAMAYFALEERRAGTPESEAYCREALEFAEPLQKPTLNHLIERLRKAQRGS